ncbi:ABC transporter ATP-binding protein [Jiella endophytica]|uniref:ABC transporter ATP-binding protein n=1 Tax=Jiella endophytica TaxID=2558362 RepID=A0A4Y8RP92_9HYPH|nr:ABC transporter ATP-binding protein [Jiella endophytica]TFF24885.1 ABC transporter ATP-binding protein [Jiella endophytica]
MDGKSVELSGVTMVFDGFTAVSPTDLSIPAGEFHSILGPSGCGKTTLLRILSGFQRPSGGQVLIGGEPVNHLPANRRPTAMIFQSLALFPRMSVRENVAFGLEARGMSKRERSRKAEELLALVALEAHADKRPDQLSGGQRQRVAVARALAVEPAVLCLDEPLSALDLKLRQHMRTELRALQKRTGVTFIYITHDQGEALTMSDRISVMNRGRIEQVGTPTEVYDAPATPFVAGFVGEQNVFSGKVTGIENGFAKIAGPGGTFTGRATRELSVGEHAVLMVRPERTGLVDATTLNGNRLSTRVEGRELEGPYLNLVTRDATGRRIVLHLANDGRQHPTGGDAVIGFMPDDAVVMPAAGGTPENGAAGMPAAEAAVAEAGLAPMGA